MKSIHAPTYITNLLNLNDTTLAGPETLSLPQAHNIFTPEHAAIIRLNACRVRRFFSIHLSTDCSQANSVPAVFTNLISGYIEDIRELFEAKATIKNARLLQMAILRCLCFYTAAQYDSSIEKHSGAEDRSSMRIRKAEKVEEEKAVRDARYRRAEMEKDRQQGQKRMYAGVQKKGKGRRAVKGSRGGSSSSSESR